MSTDQRVAYSDEDLQEFKELILKKLEQATADYELLRAGASMASGNDVADTSPTFKSLQEGATILSRGEAGQQAMRLLKFIQGLQAALVRIEKKTYGICRETGKLIPKERLRAVPHTTLSIEAKLSEKK
ncbi:TraR/DksA C4-type zinc finger protein [Porphyromonas sp. COT-239 OH1446]|uniref:TraR/DksA family transcriptional regulator n=1 Tax=Porphyromonas sp. COT-239 OH1446 TaxID=1515613 RepID=UPI00052B8FD1|nr:TraR/DksA C4-type zinc finger protein [Porphyromonas sp. COT-239 OH1446]KGN71403.1 molecular chaperone DnaK [Porphyromonas sp. COT-239 OH1446]